LKDFEQVITKRTQELVEEMNKRRAMPINLSKWMNYFSYVQLISPITRNANSSRRFDFMGDIAYVSLYLTARFSDPIFVVLRSRLAR
jgi:hypothetical protein